MSRKKEFDVDIVLNKAMEAFWTRGYEATSLNDLLACMKIQRASLYNAFGDKRTLFLQTLRRYYLLYHQEDVAKRVKAPSPRRAIIDLFQDTVAAVLKHGLRNGCFMVHTAMELAPHDKEVAEIVSAAFTHMEQEFFRKMIKRGQAKGEIAKSVKPAPTARTLLGLFIGLRVLGCSRPEKNLLESISHQIEVLLPPAPPLAATPPLAISGFSPVPHGP